MAERIERMRSKAVHDMLAHKPQTDRHLKKSRCISISPREQPREASHGTVESGFACQSVIEGRFAWYMSELALLIRRLP